MKCNCRIPLLIVAVLLAAWVCAMAGTSAAGVADQVEKIPIYAESRAANPSGGPALTNYAGCFFAEIADGDTLLGKFFVTNRHLLVVCDSLHNPVAIVDTVRAFINAPDTVVSLKLKSVVFDSALDLALLSAAEKAPAQLDSVHVVMIDLSEQASPALGERVIYGGFPRAIGVDTSSRHNWPVVLQGFVAQTRAGLSDFLIQAPVFPGASGSPVFSQSTGRLVGIVRATFQGQESLLIAVRGDSLRSWLGRQLVKQKRE